MIKKQKKTETSTTTENSTDTQDTIITSISTTSTAYNAVCNKKKTSTVSDKSSAESDPDDSIPLINVTKNKQRLQKQARKAILRKRKNIKNLSTGSNLKNKKQRTKDDPDDNIPLINVTKNKKILQKQYLKTISQKLKNNAVKRLSTGSNSLRSRQLQKKGHWKDEKSHINFHSKKHYSFRERKQKTEPCLEYTDLTDDSGEDDTYKPTKEDVYSSDSISDAESIQNIQLIRKQRKRNYRNKDRKSKGKTLKHIQSKKRKIVAVVKNKKDRSETGTLQDKQPITSNSQSPRASSVIKRSRKIEENRRVVVQYHTIRLNNLLLSNNLKRVPIAADGNCFLKAVLHGLQEGNSYLTVEKMRTDLVEHLQHERAHYNNFLSFDEQLSEEEKKRYDDYLHDLSHNGHWNSDLADMMPLALSNIYRHPIRVYSSKVANSVYDILPDLGENSSSTDFIKVALFSITGQEHYDAVEMMDTPNSTNGNSNKTPTRENISSPVSKRGSVITPRKRANYKSPVKKQLFRKMKSNPQAWKKNKRKHNRVHGLPYIGRTGKQQDQKTVKYRDCSRCRFRCSNKVSKEDAYKIFSTYYEMGSYEKQRAFLCQHVDQDKAKRTTTNRKENSNSYHLTVNEKRERICKTFFLGALDISQKTVQYPLKKKQHGVFVGVDNRGKTSSVNKTPEIDRNFIREHIKSFPTVPSHYTRKDSNRQYLSANLSLKKMFYLYEELCKKKGKKPCKINIYREMFCTEYNLAFHRPKKDQCSICTVYYEKKQRGELDDDDEEQFVRHQRNKESSRDQKTKDKQRAKTDKSFVVSTFDLEAVLPTPCSMVGDLYYKRCLSTYNLSFYSLGDGKGTCYLWDEVNGGRGSNEIGSCILMHINSVAEKNSHLKEITFYSRHLWWTKQKSVCCLCNVLRIEST